MPRTAFVTGASRGIGRAIARALAADGYHVILHYGADRASAETNAAYITAQGGTADIVGGDLAAPDGPANIAAEVSRLAQGRLDVFVANAGQYHSSPIDGLVAAEVDRVIALNMRAPLLLLSSLSPVLADGGSVVIVSSLAAHRALHAVTAYGMSKAGLEALTHHAAAEFGPRNIRVNAVSPGPIENDLMKQVMNEAMASTIMADQALKRIGQPEDIADVVAFLASDKARWVNGAVIPVNGGKLL